MDKLIIYLIAINLFSFLVMTIDCKLYWKNGKGVPDFLYFLFKISIFAGGSFGTLLSIFLVSPRKYDNPQDRKDSRAWKVLVLAVLFVQVLLIFAVFGPHSEEFLFSISLIWYEHKLLIIYLIIINLIGLIIMGIDCNRARNNQYRIPEFRIFLIAVFGGSIGIFISMFLFWHKVSSHTFTIGIPFIIIAQFVLLFYLNSISVL